MTLCRYKDFEAPPHTGTQGNNAPVSQYMALLHALMHAKQWQMQCDR